MVQAQTPQAAPKGAEPAAVGEPGAEASAEPKAVTVDLLEAVTAKLQNDLRASLGRELKALREELQPKPPASSETPTDRTLKERLAAFEERDRKHQTKAVRLAIREALQKAGADSALAEVAVPAILEQEGDRFTVKENRMGDYEAVYQEGSLADWAKLFMQGDLGKRLVVGSAAPNMSLPSGSAGAVGRRRVPLSQVRGLSNDELNSGKIEIVDG